jgi:GH35 family endo-1,4-beta-xylanase
VSTWGVTDKYPWITQPGWDGKPENKPLMFDANLQPKAAYFAMRDALLGR